MYLLFVKKNIFISHKAIIYTSTQGKNNINKKVRNMKYTLNETNKLLLRKRKNYKDIDYVLTSFFPPPLFKFQIILKVYIK